MSKKTLSYFVSMLALSGVLSSDVFATEEISELKARLEALTHQLKKLENQQNAAQKRQDEIINQKAARETQLEEKMAHIASENQALMLASKATVKNGSMPGSFLVPGTNTSLKFYGYGKADFIYTTRLYGGDNSASSMSSNFGGIPLNGTATSNRGGELNALLKESRFGFDTQTVQNFGVVDSRLEFDAYGSGTTGVRMRKAYVDFKGIAHEFLVGMQTTNFSDGDGAGGAETLDFGGIVGTPGGRPPMLRYTANVSPKFKVIVSAEEPDTSYRAANPSNDTNFENTAKDGSLKSLDHSSGSTMERLPDMILHLRVGDSKAHMSFRGLATQQSFDDGIFQKRVWGYGLAHTGRYEFDNKDSIAYDVTYGNALGKWMTSGTSASYIHHTDPAQRKFFLQNNLGLSLAYFHKWTSTLRSTLGLGYQKTYNRNEMKVQQTNKTLRDVHINLIETPIPNFDIGVEYAWGERKVEKVDVSKSPNASDKGKVHLFQVSAKYSF
jgi:hypothetical protein